MTDGEPRGSEIARRALEDARAAAKAAGKSVGRGNSAPMTGGVRRLRSGSRTWSGSGPDKRDPQRFGSLISGVSKTRGWDKKVGEGTVLGCWDTVVGPDVAAHAQAVSLREQVLYVSAESTAWATQLRLMQRQLLAKINAAVGQGVVTKLNITGPAAPSWRKGPLHVSGRGPRDTYG
jgi:predicted nucleic acid-binding Zn ribbon protein